jgi:hypothetical protein
MPTDTKINPFKPAQPHIPGVPDAPAETKPTQARPQKGASFGPASPHPASHASYAPARSPLLLWFSLAAAGVVMVAAVGIMWWAHSSSAKPHPSLSAVADKVPSTPEAPKPAGKLPVAPGEIATAAELSKPWSSKRFIFRNYLTSEEVAAIAVRLPGGALWGISLREPYGTCELQYVTNLALLRSQYSFAAEHPMVVNPCTGAVYDLARYGSAPGGLVRGEIVHGGAVRPPIGIEVVERGNKIVATRIE